MKDLIFSYTIIHRNATTRKIDLSILSDTDNSITINIHQELHDPSGALLYTDTANLTCTGEPADNIHLPKNPAAPCPADNIHHTTQKIYIPGTVPIIKNPNTPQTHPHPSGITVGL